MTVDHTNYITFNTRTKASRIEIKRIITKIRISLNSNYIHVHLNGKLEHSM